MFSLINRKRCFSVTVISLHFMVQDNIESWCPLVPVIAREDRLRSMELPVAV